MAGSSVQDGQIHLPLSLVLSELEFAKAAKRIVFRFVFQIALVFLFFAAGVSAQTQHKYYSRGAISAQDRAKLKVPQMSGTSAADQPEAAPVSLESPSLSCLSADGATTCCASWYSSSPSPSLDVAADRERPIWAQQREPTRIVVTGTAGKGSPGLGPA
jgi:hypothetical protein